MLRHSLPLIHCAIAAVTFLSIASAADQGSASELKLRESLRATMLQLRTAEAERATLQAAKTELEEKNKNLSTQIETLMKQAAANQTEADRAIAELKGKVDERDREIGGLRVTLDKWKVDHQKVTEYAKGKEAARARLAERVIVLDRQVADQQRKNMAMYKLGTEVLERYESFGLGTALTSREPFLGLTRVKFENLIQDYSDTLADERIKTEPSQPNRATQSQPGISKTNDKTGSRPKPPKTAEPAAAKPKTER